MYLFIQVINQFLGANELITIKNFLKIFLRHENLWGKKQNKQNKTKQTNKKTFLNSEN